VGQKVNPVGFRVGVYLPWGSRWFARKSYGDQLLQDHEIRKYLVKALDNAEIGNIEIEKTSENVKVIVHSARAGIVIGKKGQEIDKLRQDLAKLLGVASVEISVQEVKQPEVNATIVAKNIAKQLERRANYKKVMKKAASSALRSGAQGVKICVAGRLGGAEIARTEWVRTGSVPLHTLRYDIDYAQEVANTTFGVIGVKVWICKGEYQLKKKQPTAW
jgi:small subunit ribosomal protein S3